MNHDYMTGAELQCLREACGLSRDELGARCGVQGRSIKFWETGASKTGVPADVAELVINLEAQISRDTERTIERCEGVAEVVLMRTDDPIRNEIASRVYLDLRSRGRVVRMAMLDPHAYCAWLEQGGIHDSKEYSDEWARQAVKDQAKPHKADQPG